jgi:hypothetical protein
LAFIQQTGIITGAPLKNASLFPVNNANAGTQGVMTVMTVRVSNSRRMAVSFVSFVQGNPAGVYTAPFAS